MPNLPARVTVFLALGTSLAYAQAGAARYDAFDFTRSRIDSAMVQALPLDDLRIMRGIVFGRHGRIFSDDTLIARYLKSRPWYKADPKFSLSRLNAVERANLDVITKAEASKHPFIQPGDLRQYRGRPVTVAMLGKHTHPEWELLIAELRADRGYVFIDDTTDELGWNSDIIELQKYFDQRYWYHRREKSEALTAQDGATIDTVRLARYLDLGRISPGMMRLFDHTLLTETALKGVSIHDLRILRNEIYARRGRTFTTPWLKEFFSHEDWYKPRAGYSDRDLTEIDKTNIALITARENVFHEELSTRAITDVELQGLFPGVARQMRNEIFARRGRTFRDKTLQSYFNSMAWYKPNPAYTDNMLTALERKNVATLVAHEQRARDGDRYFPEG